MSLRAKMFLIIGGIFSVVFIVTQLMEEYLTSRSYKTIERDIQQLLEKRSIDHSATIDKYLNEVIDWQMSETNALLEKIQNMEWLNRRFSPTPDNNKLGTWLAAATLLQMNKRLDFIQCTYGQELSSMVVVDQPPPRRVRLVESLGNGVDLYVGESSLYEGDWQGPFVAVNFPFTKEYEIPLDENSDLQMYTKPKSDYFFLYSLEAIIHTNIEVLRQKINNIVPLFVQMVQSVSNSTEVSNILELLIENIEQAQQALKAHPELIQEYSGGPAQWLEKKIPNYQQIQQKDIAEKISPIDAVHIRFQQIEMIWQMALLIGSGLYDHNPFNIGGPVGVALLAGDGQVGPSVMTGDVFYPYPIVCRGEQECKVKTIVQRKGFKHPLNVVYQQATKRVFFVNGIDLFHKTPDGTEDKGALILGIDGSYILRRLALATNSNAVFVSEDKVLEAYNNEGVLQEDGFDDVPINLMIGHKSGIVEFSNQKEYYFINLTLNEEDAVHFMLYVPREEEFAIADFVRNQTVRLSRDISLQMNGLALLALVIVIVLINNVVRHITKPISQLSKATAAVSEGHLEEINLAPIEKERLDEIEGLYSSFRKMIEDLKEKEKVKGVLNKVVSPTIAEQILRGHVQLGGEEKVVTLFMADIRNFTSITEHMDPKELIEMLNGCMSRISDVIDSYDGIIDKYIGDEVMALFGAPVHYDDSAFKAVKCAIEVRDKIVQWNSERTAAGKPAIELGISVHTGTVVAGNMGAENRLNYTVLGPNVLLAQEICNMAGKMQILLSEETYRSPYVHDSIQVRELQMVKLKGCDHPIHLFEVSSGHGLSQ